MEDSGTTLLGVTSAVQIWHDAAGRWLYVRWRGRYSEEAAAGGWELLLRCLQQPCTKLLNDAQFAATSWAGREQWAGEALFPQLAQQGVRYLACVYPQALAARFSLDATLISTPQPFMAAFEDLASACSWLQQQ